MPFHWSFGWFPGSRCSRSFGEEIPRESQVADFQWWKNHLQDLGVLHRMRSYKAVLDAVAMENSVRVWVLFVFLESFQHESFSGIQAPNVWELECLDLHKQIFLTCPSWGPTWWCLLPEATSEVPRLLNALRHPKKWKGSLDAMSSNVAGTVNPRPSKWDREIQRRMIFGECCFFPMAASMVGKTM